MTVTEDERLKMFKDAKIPEAYVESLVKEALGKKGRNTLEKDSILLISGISKAFACLLVEKARALNGEEGKIKPQMITLSFSEFEEEGRIPGVKKRDHVPC